MNTIIFSLLAFINVVSLNIRIGTVDDGENSWDIRKPATIAMINDVNPDVFGLQEAMEFQVAYIQENCKNYQAIGVGRDNGGSKGEHMTIFYKTDRFECKEWGTFWLSDTPDKPSKGWDGRYPRTATWAFLYDIKAKKTIIFVNTHLDHIGKDARKNGLELIMKKVDEINENKFPVVLCGDFNCTYDDPAMESVKSVMEDSRSTAKKTDNVDSFNNWGNSSNTIDFIWQKGFSKCKEFETLTGPYADKPYVSDHYPIRAIFKY